MIPWEGLARTKRKAVGRALDRADDDAAGIEKVQSTAASQRPITLLCLLRLLSHACSRPRLCVMVG